MPSAAGDGRFTELLVLTSILFGCASSPPRTVAAPSGPERLECSYTWAGATKSVRVDPAPDPYAVPAIAVDDDFLLKIVYVKEPADVASVRVYTYLPSEPAPLPLTESKFRPPFAQGGAFGFTGQTTVYDPRGHELQYFCAWVKR